METTQPQQPDGLPRAYQPSLSIWASFRTHADAKLAQLVWDHDISIHTIDLILGLLRDPQFCATEVTFAKAAEIDLRVADYQAELAHHRSTPFYQGAIGRIHHDVLEMIIQDVAGHDWDSDLLFTSYDQLNLYNEQILKAELNTPRKLEARDSDLRSMSLVHRTWTPLAQKYLRRDVTIKGVKDLRLLRNPLFGPWTRRITLSLDDLPYNGPDLHDQVEIIEAVLTQSSNLSTLFFKPPVAEDERSPRTQALTRLIDVVGRKLHSLERLFWVVKPSSLGYSHFEELCVAIARLPSLELLSLSGIGCHETDKYRALFLTCVGATPAPRIKELFLSHLPDIFPIKLLRWLANPAPGATITHLTIDPNRIKRPRNLGDVLSALEPALPFLQSLWIMSSDNYKWEGSEEDPGMGQLLAKCTTLRRLGMACYMPVNDLLDFMPSTLEEIDIISLHGSTSYHINQDSHLYRYLCDSEHPHLRRLTWKIPDWQIGLRYTYEEERASMLTLMKAREVCAKEGIEFAINMKSFPPR